MPLAARLRRTLGGAPWVLLLLGACVPLPAKTPDLLAVKPLPAMTSSPAAILPVSPPVQEIPEAFILPEGSIQEAVAPTHVAMPPDYSESFATYYAKRFNGRRTSSGERYDPDGMTAATRDFPMQSMLKVINPVNGKEVTVRVNDRTGKRKTPLIDLSRAAAKELGFLGKGKIHVHVIPLPSSTLPNLAGK